MFKSEISKKSHQFTKEIRKQLKEDYFRARRLELLSYNPIHQINSTYLQTYENMSDIQMNAFLDRIGEGELKSNVELQKIIMIRSAKSGQVQTYVLLSNLISRNDFIGNDLSDELVEVITNRIIQQCKDYDYQKLQVVCWLITNIFKKKQLKPKIKIIYRNLVDKLGIYNIFLLTMWGELSVEAELVPDYQQIMKLMETKLSYIDANPPLRSVITLALKPYELIYRIIQIISNYLDQFQQQSFSLNYQQQLQYLKWITSNIQLRALPNHIKTQFINTLSILINSGVNHLTMKNISQSIIMSQLLIRAKMDSRINKLACLNCLTLIVKWMEESELQKLVSETNIVQVLMSALQFEERQLVVNLLKSIGNILLNGGQIAKQKAINANINKHLNIMFKHQCPRIFQLASLIAEQFFREI